MLEWHLAPALNFFVFRDRARASLTCGDRNRVGDAGNLDRIDTHFSTRDETRRYIAPAFYFSCREARTRDVGAVCNLDGMRKTRNDDRRAASGVARITGAGVV